MQQNPIWIPILATVALPAIGALGYGAYKSQRDKEAAAQLELAQEYAEQRRQQSLIGKVRMEAMLQKIEPLLWLSIPIMLGSAYYLHATRDSEGDFR